jgi:hypothetical protein
MRTVGASHELLPKGLELESLSLGTGHVSICVGSGATSWASSGKTDTLKWGR